MGNEKFKIQNTTLNGRKVKILRLPMTKKDVLDLHVGDVVLINGLLVTGRDKLHTYLFNERPSKERIPFNLDGSILYHCGPIIQKTPRGYRCIAGGPTTSMRVEMYESWIIAEYGIRGVMGKGGMGRRTLHALKEFGCVYLHTIGGAAVYLADRVKRVSGVWKLEEFGMAEAMWILEVNDFPAIVTMDAFGKSFHDEIEMRSRKVLRELLELHQF
jgi:tartrate/fumarate subfamily iron-sulfur-dependent hydro-lyase beta chain